MKRMDILLQGVFDYSFFGNITFFFAVVVTIFGLLGLLSRYVSVGIFGAFMAFTEIATKVGIDFYLNLFYATFVLMLVVMAFRVWSFGSSGGEMEA